MDLIESGCENDSYSDDSDDNSNEHAHVDSGDGDDNSTDSDDNNVEQHVVKKTNNDVEVTSKSDAMDSGDDSNVSDDNDNNVDQHITKKTSNDVEVTSKSDAMDSGDDSSDSDDNTVVNHVAKKASNDMEVTSKSEESKSDAMDTTDNESPKLYTQRDWRAVFIKRNPLYRRVKIRYENVAFIKPRAQIPATGKPCLYVCEGAENWNGRPNLLCAGQVVTIEKVPWVVLAVVWVGCLVKTINGRKVYSCSSKAMRTLLFPLRIFDKEEVLLPRENELRLEKTFM